MMVASGIGIRGPRVPHPEELDQAAARTPSLIGSDSKSRRPAGEGVCVLFRHGNTGHRLSEIVEGMGC